MLNHLIRFALRSRALILGISILVIVLGIQTARELPVEVLPDLTKPTVVVLTEAPGLAPEEVEVNVTLPIERSLMGVAGLTRLRSNSDVALSLVYAEFDWGTDIYRARQLVQERLRTFGERLPRSGQPLLHELPRPVDVGAPIELGVDERKGHVGIGPEPGEPPNPHERTLDGQGDIHLHFLRRKAGRFGEHDHGGLG